MDDSVFNRIQCCDKKVTPPQETQLGGSHIIALSPQEAGTPEGVSRITGNACVLEPK